MKPGIEILVLAIHQGRSGEATQRGRGERKKSQVGPNFYHRF